MAKNASLLVLGLSVAACSQHAPDGCPDNLRLAHIAIPHDQNGMEDKVNDCIREYGSRVAKGASSDRDAAEATVTYCGIAQWIPGDAEQVKSMQKSEISLALEVVVSARAFKCPEPRTRNIGGNFN